MFAWLRLFWLEFLLQHQLGMWHAYRNAVHDQGATSTQARIGTALAILNGPSLERGRRWFEYVRLTQRGERPW
jgi:hypothetical protein